jgi:DnaJ like chaperone protein
MVLGEGTRFLNLASLKVDAASMPWKVIKNALGLHEGGRLRTALDGLWGKQGVDRLTIRSPAKCGIAFTIAVVSLAAKMSKADGVSTQLEAEAFEQIFHTPHGELENIRYVFKLASQDVAGFESYALQINDLLTSDPELKTSILECLFCIATADGVLHPGEDAYLEKVAELFGFSKAQYRGVRRAFVHDPDSPYEILGVDPRASDEEIKKLYRALAKEHHADVLSARGVPHEFLIAAEKRLAAINNAYEAILTERGQKVTRALERSP